MFEIGQTEKSNRKIKQFGEFRSSSCTCIRPNSSPNHAAAISVFGPSVPAPRIQIFEEKMDGQLFRIFTSVLLWCCANSVSGLMSVDGRLAGRLHSSKSCINFRTRMTLLALHGHNSNLSLRGGDSTSSSRVHAKYVSALNWLENWPLAYQNGFGFFAVVFWVVAEVNFCSQYQ